jgi:hypothetical protein
MGHAYRLAIRLKHERALRRQRGERGANVGAVGRKARCELGR